jgi:hypothetical protein
MSISRMVIEGLERLPVHPMHPSRAGCHQAQLNESQSMLNACQQEGTAMLMSCQLRGGDVIKQQRLRHQVATTSITRSPWRCTPGSSRTRNTHREDVHEHASGN